MKMHFHSPLDGALWAVSHFDAPVFPCARDGKEPFVKHWRLEASKDENVIRQWAETKPGCNFGMATDGLVAADIDTTKGDIDAAIDSYLSLQSCFPFTCVQRTASGALHAFSRGDAKKRKLAQFPGVDFQASGQYVMAPGSRIGEGSYWMECTGPVPATPEWLLQALPAAPPADAKPIALGQGEALDLPENAAAAVRAACEWPAAVEGANSDYCVYRLALRFRDLAISPGLTLELWQDYFAPRCDFTETDGLPNDVWLRRKIASAWNSAEDAVGSRSVAVFEPLVDLPPAPGEKPIEPMPFYRPLTRKVATDVRWLVHGLLPRRGTCMLAGASGAGKTFICYDLMRRVMLEKHWFGRDIDEAVGVLYVAGEDGGSTVERATAAVDGVAFDPETTPLLAIDGAPSDLLTNEGFAAFGKTVEAAVKELAKGGHRLGIIVLDTLAATFAMADENSAADAAKITNAMTALAKRFGVLVVCVHHHGKDATRGMRGSNAFFANVDIVLDVHDKTVTARKVRNGCTGPVGEFALAPVTLAHDEKNRPITSMQVVPKPGLGEAHPDITETTEEETSFAKAFDAVDLDNKGYQPLADVMAALARMQDAKTDDPNFQRRAKSTQDKELAALRFAVRGEIVHRVRLVGGG